MKIILAIAALMLGTSALAADYQPLKGTYKVGSKTLIDPPASEPQDTHFYLDLEGNAARNLYKTMKAKAQSAECGEPGDLTKRQGGVQSRWSRAARNITARSASNWARSALYPAWFASRRSIVRRAENVPPHATRT
jgi:hypothetical protein